MRVLSVHNFYLEAGGEDVVVEAEVNLLRDHNHEVVEYREHNRRIAEYSRVDSAFNTVWSRRSSQRIADALRKWRPDVAHFHNTFPLISPSAYYACRRAGVPVVQTLHNFRLGCPRATYFRDGRVCEDCLGKGFAWPGIAHACYRQNRTATAVIATMSAVHRAIGTWHNQVDVYIALSEFARSKHIAAGVRRESIVVKPNCVHPDPGVGDHLGAYVVMVGRLSAEKGVETVLRAWRTLKGVPLKIVGDGPLRSKVESAVSDGDIGGSVEVLGPQPRSEVIRLVQHAACLLFPSECYENFPMAIAEAYACGTPVIGSRLGTMAEIIIPEQTGLVFNPGDALDLGERVSWAMDHPSQLHSMGVAARQEFEQKYTAERSYQQLMDIYARAAGAVVSRSAGRMRDD